MEGACRLSKPLSFVLRVWFSSSPRSLQRSVTANNHRQQRYQHPRSPAALPTSRPGAGVHGSSASLGKIGDTHWNHTGSTGTTGATDHTTPRISRTRTEMKEYFRNFVTTASACAEVTQIPLNPQADHGFISLKTALKNSSAAVPVVWNVLCTTHTPTTHTYNMQYLECSPYYTRSVRSEPLSRAPPQAFRCLQRTHTLLFGLHGVYNGNVPFNQFLWTSSALQHYSLKEKVNEASYWPSRWQLFSLRVNAHLRVTLQSPWAFIYRFN